METKNNTVKIVATLGPASSTPDVFFKMVEAGLDIVRFNFAWGDETQRIQQLDMIHAAEIKFNKKIPIIVDLPGPRIQLSNSHTYDATEGGAVEPADKEHIAFAIKHNCDYIAASFIGSAADITTYRQTIKEYGGNQKLIAKIERKIAIEHVDEIIAASDMIMIARGDMGNEIPLEQIPFVQASIIEKTNTAHKPVIVATQMLLSMTKNPTPERAEVSDVADAITEGTSAVMLSEESASGAYPVEAVSMMKKIVTEAQHHQKISPVCIGGVLSTPQKMGKLFLIRHQESEWNAQGLWTGSRDIHLTENGFEKSREIGDLIADQTFDYAFASMQIRSIETLTSILEEDGKYSIPTEHVAALNERSYGDYTGKNKWEMEKEVGEEAFQKIRRDWDCPIPNGETLKMVYERSVPFFLEKVLPLLSQNKNVLIVSHGNTIRSLMKYIEQISDTDIATVEMLFSDVLIYHIDCEGHMINKEIRSLITK